MTGCRTVTSPLHTRPDVFNDRYIGHRGGPRSSPWLVIYIYPFIYTEASNHLTPLESHENTWRKVIGVLGINDTARWTEAQVTRAQQTLRQQLVNRRGGAVVTAYTLLTGKLACGFSRQFRLVHPGRPHKSDHLGQSPDAVATRIIYLIRILLRHVSMRAIDIHKGVKFKMKQIFCTTRQSKWKNPIYIYIYIHHNLVQYLYCWWGRWRNCATRNRLHPAHSSWKFIFTYTNKTTSLASGKNHRLYKWSNSCSTTIHPV